MSERLTARLQCRKIAATGGGVKRMRPATKHWLLLVFLIASLAIMVAVVLWQIAKARHEGGPPQALPVPTSRGHLALAWARPVA